jgi:hypothetical protein
MVIQCLQTAEQEMNDRIKAKTSTIEDEMQLMSTALVGKTVRFSAILPIGEVWAAGVIDRLDFVQGRPIVVDEDNEDGIDEDWWSLYLDMTAWHPIEGKYETGVIISPWGDRLTSPPELI